MDATTARPSVAPRAVRIRAPELLTVVHSSAFRQTVLREAEDGGQEIVLVLDETTYIDAAGLGVLVSLQKRLRDHHGAALVLEGINEDLATLFAITKLDTLLTIRASGAGGVSPA